MKTTPKQRRMTMSRLSPTAQHRLIACTPVSLLGAMLSMRVRSAQLAPCAADLVLPEIAPQGVLPFRGEVER